MKNTVTMTGLMGMVVVGLLAGLSGCARNSMQDPVGAQTASVGCGSCIYGMEGVEGCETAITLDGKHYLVTGGIDAHEAGLCESEKQAVVTGEVKDGKFVATSFKMK